MDLEDDVLLVDEDIELDLTPPDSSWWRLFVEPGFDCLTGQPLKSTATPTTPPPAQPRREVETPRPKQTIVCKHGPYPEAKINGQIITNWELLRPSKTIDDIKMRLDNDVQKFVTREGDTVFIEKKVLKRIDFEKIKKTKSKDFKINLPNRHEVKVHVYSDNRVVLHHYRKRKR